MWLISLLPSGLMSLTTNLLLFVGVLATLAGFLLPSKYLMQYKLYAQVIGIIALTFGVYFKGGEVVETKWKAKVAVLEAKVKVAEAKAKEVNVVVKEKIVEKVKVVTETKYKIKLQTQTVKEIINQDCKINDTALEQYNAAVTNTYKEPEKVNDTALEQYNARVEGATNE